MRYDELREHLLNTTANDWLYEDSEGVFTFKNDLLVTIRRAPQEERHSFAEPWAAKFPDPNAWVELYDLFYGPSLVERFYFASVDGGRAAIPYPKSRDDLRITAWQYAIARAVSRGSELDKYLERAGIGLA